MSQVDDKTQEPVDEYQWPQELITTQRNVPYLTMFPKS